MQWNEFFIRYILTEIKTMANTLVISIMSIIPVFIIHNISMADLFWNCHNLLSNAVSIFHNLLICVMWQSRITENDPNIIFNANTKTMD